VYVALVETKVSIMITTLYTQGDVLPERVYHHWQGPVFEVGSFAPRNLIFSHLFRHCIVTGSDSTPSVARELKLIF
jgi:hypothetical protein